MKITLITLVFLILIMFHLSCGYVIKNENSKSLSNNLNYVDLNITESYEIFQKNKGNRDFIILDVRTPEEYKTGHLENAVNMNSLSGEFKEMLSTLDTDKTYIVYCRSGGRSSNALKVMKEMGFKNVYHMLGGINAWIGAKYQIVEY